MSASYQNRRRFPRYKLTNFPLIRASLSLDEFDFHDLVTLGKGACGFFSYRSDLVFPKGSDVQCYFEWPDVLSYQVGIPGKLVYSVLKSVEGIDAFALGVQFSEESIKLMEPIVSKLEAMLHQGELVLPAD